MRARFLPLLAFVLVSAQAFAQARTWVSGLGDDANPCSYSLPCRTFAGAYVKTAAGGMISVQDPGSYGQLTISKSITIDGGGNYASVLHSGAGDGFTISFSTNDAFQNTVVLRGLSFDSNLSGYSVVVFGSVATHVHIDDCTFTRAGAGIGVFTGAAGSSLHVTNTSISKQSSRGIVVDGPAGSPLRLTVRNVDIRQGGSNGIQVYDNVNGTISDTRVSDGVNGIAIENSSSHLTLVRTVLSENTGSGLRHVLAGTTTLIDGCSIVGNQTGISNAGSTVLGFSNNTISNNVNDVAGNAVQSLLQQ